MTPKEHAMQITHNIMFKTSIIHLDEVKEIADLIVNEIKLNTLDSALPYWNQVKKEIQKL